MKGRSRSIGVCAMQDVSPLSHLTALFAFVFSLRRRLGCPGRLTAAGVWSSPSIDRSGCLCIASPSTSREKVPEEKYLRSIATMRTSLADELLPYHELKESLSVLSGRLDGGVAKQLQARV